MGRKEFYEKMDDKEEEKSPLLLSIVMMCSGFALILVLLFGILYLTGGLHRNEKPTEVASVTQTTNPPQTTLSPEEFEAYVMTALSESEHMAAMYDYEKAIQRLQEIENYEAYEGIVERIKFYEEEQKTLVKWADNTQITHIFFHSLIYDEKLAWASSKADDYNQNMATIDEFNQIIEKLYEDGYVLVGLHDIAKMVEQEDGSMLMTYQSIYLPEGKKPFVLSQDDVCYYEYMKGHGFASRLVVGSDGKVTTEMDLASGQTVTGAFDLIPLIEEFVEAHPDFSYHGSKGVIAVTGYEGVFGYRTSEYHYGKNFTGNGYYENLNIEEDRKSAMKVAQALRDTGWEIASHSWGHPSLGSCDWDRFTWDVDMWEQEVEPIVGETDILLFPFGADVGTWRPYAENQIGWERFEYLQDAGFQYLCTVDSSQYWVQKGTTWFRQGRRNIDGTRMYQAICGTDYLADLFVSEDIFSELRPTPVGNIRPKEEETSEVETTEGQ